MQPRRGAQYSSISDSPWVSLPPQLQEQAVTKRHKGRLKSKTPTSCMILPKINTHVFVLKSCVLWWFYAAAMSLCLLYQAKWGCLIKKWECNWTIETYQTRWQKVQGPHADLISRYSYWIPNLKWAFFLFIRHLYQATKSFSPSLRKKG